MRSHNASNTKPSTHQVLVPVESQVPNILNLAGAQALGLAGSSKDGAAALLGSGFLSRGFSSCCPLPEKCRQRLPSSWRPRCHVRALQWNQGSWELDRHEVFPQTPSTSIPKIFFLQACQIFSRKITPMAMPEPAEQRAASTSQPRLTAGLPAWVFPPHRTSQKGLFRLFAGEESLPRQVRVSGLHQLCVP